MEKYNFCGWATKNDLRCSDGRIIRKDAFKHCDGMTVPLVWNHDHADPFRVVGHAILENREEGVYTYGYFNDTELGKTAKIYVEHGDINQLSIYANQLQQQGPNVMHGSIREVSLVLAGANPGAFIENVIKHSDGDDPVVIDDEAWISTGEGIEFYHAEGGTDMPAEENKNDGKTVQDVLDTMNEEQRDVVSYLVAKALEEGVDDEDESEGGEDSMKQNVFENDKEQVKQGGVLSHADEQAILELAKSNGGCTLSHAIEMYINSNDELKHGFVDEEGNEAIDQLFPEYKLVKTGAPELLERDMTWVDAVMRGVHKSPISRIRTRFADARAAELTAKGHKKGQEKTKMGNIKLLNRTTDPQTVYVKDEMHRDDILDIQDFDVVEYKYTVMRHVLSEKLALAIMVGDGLDEGEKDKISEEHIRPIWQDDDLYTIHYDVNIAAAKAELQGTNTGANFGQNYIYAEAIIAAALHSREQYKGKGSLEFYCTPHLLNVMMLARDLNGRRIYESKNDLAAALDVKAIHTAEQFEGLTRTTKDGKTKKLLGLFVNLNSYHLGSVKGGEITRFTDFDIDFNSYKYLIETRVSGAQVDPYTAIALEEDVTDAA